MRRMKTQHIGFLLSIVMVSLCAAAAFAEEADMKAPSTVDNNDDQLFNAEPAARYRCEMIIIARYGGCERDGTITYFKSLTDRLIAMQPGAI